jgi:hypothetical protein
VLERVREIHECSCISRLGERTALIRLHWGGTKGPGRCQPCCRRDAAEPLMPAERPGDDVVFSTAATGGAKP